MKKINFKNSKFILSISLILTLLITIFSHYPSASAVGDGSSAYPYTVAQGKANQNNTLKTVQGYVVGMPTSATAVITSNYTGDTAVAIADSPTETNQANMLFVQIPTTYRTTFGLKTNPTLKGSLIKVTGYLTAYFSPHAGIKDLTKMEKVTQSGGGSTGGSTGGTTTTTSPYDSTYYATAIGKSGADLKATLHNIIDNHTQISYDAVWDALRYTDEDPNNPNNVILLYSGRSQGKFTNGGDVNDWNREHVWAKSHGDFGTTAGAGTDLHHMKPEDVSVNSTRGNLDFDMGGVTVPEATLCKYDSDSWEPRDSVKGDIARAIFYMATRYEGHNGEVDLELNNLTNNDLAPYMGKLSVLLQWNQQDPVDEFEKKRNDIIYNKYQHNRNPFIDHPEWVNAIWAQ